MRHDNPLHGWFLDAPELFANGGRRIEPGDKLAFDPWKQAPDGELPRPTSEEPGFFACRQLVYCLSPARGTHVWRVRLEGDILENNTEAYGAEMVVLWGLDIGGIITTFSRSCALEALKVNPVEVHPYILRFLRRGDERDFQSAQDAMNESAPKVLPEELVMSCVGFPVINFHGSDYSSPDTLSHFAVYCAVRSCGWRSRYPALAARWAAGALVARLKLLEASGHDFNSALSLANKELEDAVWQAAGRQPESAFWWKDNNESRN